jgi:quercetin dioxygenase-like cupin family protein
VKLITPLLPALMLALATTVVRAQDPVKVDPKHYKVEFENDQVRVLRIQYGAGEKSVMHSHPDNVAVFLTDDHVRFSYPDGKSEEVAAKKGEVKASPAGPHLPENIGDKPFELILVEMKGKPAEKK